MEVQSINLSKSESEVSLRIGSIAACDSLRDKMIVTSVLNGRHEYEAVSRLIDVNKRLA